MFQTLLLKSADEETQFKTDLNEIESSLTESKQILGESSLNISHLAVSRQEIEKEYDELFTIAEASRLELLKIERGEVEIKEKEKHYKSKIKKLEKAIHSEKLSISESETWVRNFDSDVSSRTSDLTQLEKRMIKEKESLDVITDGLRDKTSGIQIEIEGHQKRLDPILSEINNIKSQISTSEAEFGNLREKVTGVEIALNDANKNMQELKVLKMEKAFLVEDNQSKLDTLQQELDDSVNSRSESTNVLSNLKQKLSSANQRVNEAKSMMNNSQTKNVVNKSLKKLAQSGKVSGYCVRI